MSCRRSLGLAMLLCIGCLARAQAQGTTFAVTGGIVIPAKGSFYLDDPINHWADRKLSILGGVQYLWQVSTTFSLGVYTEYESLANDYTDAGKRIGTGGVWVGRVPANMRDGIGFDFGGSFGVAGASLPHLDGQFGIDYGAFLGPVFKVSNHVMLALHLIAHYGWYGGGKVPEGMQNSQPRITVTVYGHQ